MGHTRRSRVRMSRVSVRMTGPMMVGLWGMIAAVGPLRAQDPDLPPPQTPEELLQQLDQVPADPHWHAEQAARMEEARRLAEQQHHPQAGSYDPGTYPQVPGHDPHGAQPDPAQPADSGIKLDAEGMPEISEQELRELEDLLRQADEEIARNPELARQLEQPPAEPEPPVAPGTTSPPLPAPTADGTDASAPHRHHHQVGPQVPVAPPPPVTPQPGTVTPGVDEVAPPPPEIQPPVQPPHDVPGAPPVPGAPAAPTGQVPPAVPGMAPTPAEAGQPGHEPGIAPTPGVPAQPAMDAGSNAPPDATVPKDPRTGLPDLKTTPRWWSLPAEDRPYFFVWKDTPLDKTFEDLKQMTGLSMIGQNLLDLKAARPISFTSVKIMDFDEALLTFNLLIADLDYWVLRRENYLEVRRLTEWYRYIPPSRMYSSVEAFREANLPAWELASVIYEPREESARVLAERAVDIVPVNTARATVLPYSNRIELKGFVYYINRQLDYILANDVPGRSSDGREVRVYTLKYASPEDAARLLDAMLPPEGGRTVTPGGPAAPGGRVNRGANPAQPAPTPVPEANFVSTADNVDITTDTRLQRLLVRATPAKHKLIAEYLENYIDLPNKGGMTELVKLSHTDPNDIVEMVRPLLGEQQLVQQPAPPARPGQPQPPPPPPKIVTVGSMAVLTPIPANRSVLIKAPPDEMAQIKEYIQLFDVPEEVAQYQLVRLEHASAASMANLLNQVIGGRSSSPTPFYNPMMPQVRTGGTSAARPFSAVADPITDRTLVLIGEQRDRERAGELIRQLDVDPEAGTVERLVQLKNANPEGVASLLQSRFGGSTAGGSRSNIYRPTYFGAPGSTAPAAELPRFIPDDNSRMLIVICLERMWPEIERVIKTIDESSEVARTTKTYRIQYASASELSGLLAQSFGGTGGSRYNPWAPPARTTDRGPSFQFVAATNTLVVTADEETHAKAVALIKELDQPGPADLVKLRAIQVRTADVEYVVEKLQEIFPGATGGRGSSPFSPYGVRSPGGPDKPPVSIVAETISNRVLITSTEEDFARAEEFVRQIDADHEARKFERRTFTIRHADADEIMSAIQAMFSPEGGGGGARWGGGWYGGRQGGTTLRGGIKISQVGNTLVVLAPADRLAEIEQLITTLDTDKRARHEIRTYRVENVDSTGTMQIARDLEQLYAVSGSGTRGWGGRGAAPDEPRFIGGYASNLLLVSAPPEKMAEIDKTVQEMLKARVSADLTLVIRHYEIRRANPDDVAGMITPILQAKYNELQNRGGGRMGGYFGADGPQVVAHKGARRVMVTAPASLLPLVEELIAEFDRPAEPSVMRIVALQTGRAVEIAEVVNQQINRRGGGGTGGFYRSSWRNRWSPYMDAGGSTGGTEELTVTPVESSNIIMLRGSEEKVYEAERLIAQLDAQARPEGPMIKVYELRYADVYDVVTTLENLAGGTTGGGSDSFSGYGSFGSSRRGPVRAAGGGEGIIIQPDMMGKRIIVSAPYEKIPLIDQLVEMKERMAQPQAVAQVEGQGKILDQNKDGVTKSYTIKQGNSDDVARELDKILVARYGFWDSPYVKSFPWANEVIVTAKPEQFKEVEHWLGVLEANPPAPKIVLKVLQAKEVSPGRAVELVQGAVPPSMRDKISVTTIPRGKSRAAYLNQIDEIKADTPIIPPGENQGAVVRPAGGQSPCVAPGALAALRREVEVLASVAGVKITVSEPAGTQPAAGEPPVVADTRPAADTQPAADAPPAEAASTGEAPAAGAEPAEPPAPQVAATAPAPEAVSPAVAAMPPAEPGPTEVPAEASPPAVPPTETLQASADAQAPPPSPIAAAPAPAPQPVAEPAAGPAPPVAVPPGPVAARAAEPAEEPSAEDLTREMVQRSAAEAFTTGNTRIMIDEEAGAVYLVGPQNAVEGLSTAIENVMKQLGEAQGEIESDTRVIRLRYIDVTIAASILEQMFNDRQPGPAQPGPAARQNRRDRNQPRQPAAERGTRREGDEDEGSLARRRREEEEERAREQEEQARAAMGGTRIRVFPNPRDQTLIIKASKEDFPLIAELLLKIDRPSDRPPVDIRIFQLKQLNAYEVEQAIKAILKIEDTRTRSPRMRFPGNRPGMAGGAFAGVDPAMIEELEQQMLEMQTLMGMQLEGQPGSERPGAVKLNPNKDITLTSDATTNSIIVSAPADGMKLVETLINRLEEQKIPTEIKTFPLRHAEAPRVAEELQKVFTAGGGGRRGRGGDFGGEEGINPSRMGSITIAADERTNSLIIRALAPDMEKVGPIIEVLDAEPALEQQVRLYTVVNADARSIAETLRGTFVEDTRATGSKAVRISAEPNTNTIMVWAPESKQKAIETRIVELDRIAGERTTPRPIQLKVATPTNVAAALLEVFGQRGSGRSGRQAITITGDDASKTLFVSAPPEKFEEIRKMAEMMDQTTTSDIRVFKLEHAVAADVLARFKEMMSQLIATVGRSGVGENVFAVSADERTNSLIVAGTPAIFLMVQKVLVDLDSPPSENMVQQTHMFPLIRGNATSVAQTINSLYGGKVWVNGQAAPKAVAEAGANVVYVTGTRSQIDQIKASVIDPLEGYSAGGGPTVLRDHQIPVRYAKVEEVAATLNTLFQQRFAAMRQANAVLPPAELAVSIVPDAASRQLLVTCTDANRKVIDDLLATIDVEGATDRGQQTKVIPIKFADLSYTVQALTQTFSKGPRTPPAEQVTITPEYGTQSIIIKAPATDMQAIEELIARIDRADAAATIPQPQTVRLEHAKASDLVRMLTDVITRTKRRDRTTGLYPVSVSADDTSNTVLVTANSAKEMEDMIALIKQSDVPPPTDTVRTIKSYPLQYADLATVSQAINVYYADNAKRPVHEQVTVTADYANNALMVTASEENHRRIGEIIQGLDVSTTGSAVLPRTVKIEKAKASDVASTLNAIVQRSMKVDRRTGLYPIYAVADDSSNTLIVTANDRYWKQAEELIQQLDTRPATEDERVIAVYPLRFADLSTVQQAINVHFADNARRPIQDQVSLTPDYTNNALMVTASPENQQRIADIIQGLDVSTTGNAVLPRTVKIEKAKASDVASTLNAIVQRSMKVDRRTGLYPIYAVADDSSNTLIVTANDRYWKQAEELIQQLDTRPATEDERVIAVYPLRFADLSTVQQAINVHFADNARRPIQDQVSLTPDYTNNALMVTASPENHEKIRGILGELDKPDIGNPRVPTPIKVQHVLASDLAKTLTEMIRTTKKVDKRTGLYPVTVTANDAANTVLVTASAADLEEIRGLIEKLDVPLSRDDTRRIKPYPIRYADASSVMTIIRNRFDQNKTMGPNAQVDVTVESGTNSLVVTASAENHAIIEEILREIDVSSIATRQNYVIDVKQADPTELATQLSNLYNNAMPRTRGEGRVKAVFTPVPGASKIVVTCNETELAEVTRLIDQLDRESPTTTRQEIIRLTNARADELAQVVSTTLRSRKVKPGVQSPSVAADGNTNSLVVMAAAEDLAAIKELVAELDKPVDENMVEELRVFPLQYVDASETRQILAEYLRKPGARPGTGAGELIGDIRIQASPTMNTLIVSGSSAEIDRVEKIIRGLDQEVEGASNAPQIIPLKHTSAAQLAATLSRMFTEPARQMRRTATGMQDSVPLILADEQTNALIVRARKVDYNLIAEMAAKLDTEPTGPSGLEVVQVARGVNVRQLAQEIERTVNAGEQAKARQQQGYRPGSISIGVDDRVPALIVAGSPELFQTVRQLVEKLQTMKPTGQMSARVIPVRNIPAQDMKKVIEQLINQQNSQGTGRPR